MRIGRGGRRERRPPVSVGGRARKRSRGEAGRSLKASARGGQESLGQQVEAK